MVWWTSRGVGVLATFLEVSMGLDGEKNRDLVQCANAGVCGDAS